MIKQLRGRRYVPDKKVLTIPYAMENVRQLLEFFPVEVLEISERLMDQEEPFAEWVSRWEIRGKGTVSRMEEVVSSRTNNHKDSSLIDVKRKEQLMLRLSVIRMSRSKMPGVLKVRLIIRSGVFIRLVLSL